MKVLVLVVGSVRGSLATAVSEYEDRASRYWKLEVVEVASGAAGRSPAAERVRDEEAERILSRLPDQAEVWALTREGKGMGSTELARTLEERAIRSTPTVAFVIGGAFGLGRSVLDRAVRKLSLSSMTLPHEMARVVLAEQLYRAGSILRGEPYHKGA
jgi:23S rRNA (pseudouridine1915-N3)-methyltransferase